MNLKFEVQDKLRILGEKFNNLPKKDRNFIWKTFSNSKNFNQLDNLLNENKEIIKKIEMNLNKKKEELNTLSNIIFLLREDNK